MTSSGRPATPLLPALPDDPRDDAGLAAQRTAMSYGRSALSFAGLAALFARHGVERGALGLALPMAALLLAVAALLSRWTAKDYAQLPLRASPGVARPEAVGLLARGTLAAAAGAGLLVVLA